MFGRWLGKVSEAGAVTKLELCLVRLMSVLYLRGQNVPSGK
jgi:hypothetical protein